ncbi:carboxymuconolactone decarboxylase family protein [Rubinisphaera margarita]|uniref:carboxymuconolactone decarboxylase family protein n=1 Tax=Rubinisphaera margarita TaxID=2909586 RepID=UPI001EE866A3|nr:carboxymuconolactone decarboxylase family protein [Rubinisphaera margarita]MCG6156935.1 carboxymuconolactone decarboxylase family protein [Rubinisphaera margarita]
MLGLKPVAEENAEGKVAQVYGRLHDLLGPEPLPEGFLLMGNVEPFLGDFYMNFKKFVWSPGKIDENSKAAIALAVAVHAHSKYWVEFYTQRCRDLGWGEQQLAELVAISTTNYMYNTFFKFRKISGTDRFDGMPVGLRAHTFSSTSLEVPLIELVNIAISDLNACEPCVQGHISKANEVGVSHEMMLEAVQCASTVYAGCQFTSAVA